MFIRKQLDYRPVVKWARPRAERAVTKTKKAISKQFTNTRRSFKKTFSKKKNQRRAIYIGSALVIAVLLSGLVSVKTNADQTQEHYQNILQDRREKLESLETELDTVHAEKTKTEIQLKSKKQHETELKTKIDELNRQLQAKKQREQSIASRVINTVTMTRPVYAESHYSGGLGDWLLKLRMCESGGNYRINTGNSFYGAYQFTIPTWDYWKTGYARADLAPPSVQDATIIKNTNAASGGLTTQNPGCYASQGLSAYPPQ